MPSVTALAAALALARGPIMVMVTMIPDHVAPRLSTGAGPLERRPPHMQLGLER